MKKMLVVFVLLTTPSSAIKAADLSSTPLVDYPDSPTSPDQTIPEESSKSSLPLLKRKKMKHKKTKSNLCSLQQNQRHNFSNYHFGNPLFDPSAGTSSSSSLLHNQNRFKTSNENPHDSLSSTRPVSPIDSWNFNQATKITFASGSIWYIASNGQAHKCKENYKNCNDSCHY